RLGNYLSRALFASTRGSHLLAPFGLLVHGRRNLELAIERMLGWVDGHPPTKFAVEVQPQKILILRRDADYAVSDAQWDDGNLARRDFDVLEFGHVERIAAKLDAHLLTAQRPMKRKLLVLHVVSTDPHACRLHQRLGTGVFSALADDCRKMVESSELADSASRTVAPEAGDADEGLLIHFPYSGIHRADVPEVHLLNDLALGS